MYPLKVPGSDVMPPLFFQHFWPTIGDVVIKIVLDFLNAGISPPNFHDTHIVLVPKCKEPKRITDYIGLLAYVMWCIKLHQKVLLTG